MVSSSPRSVVQLWSDNPLHSPPAAMCHCQSKMMGYTLGVVALVSLQLMFPQITSIHAFIAPTTLAAKRRTTSHAIQQRRSLSKSDGEWDDENQFSNNNLKEEDDWRAFRAQLVRSETADTTNTMNGKTDNTSTSRWAYDSGDLVERGSIVLSVPSSDPSANDIDALNNQCYRKSIVLVLDVQQNFIQGIILNRPTNIGVKQGMQFVQPGHGEVFENEIGSCDGSGSSPHRWKVWFGGEVAGPFSEYPQVMCLHSVNTDLGVELSDAVLPGILVSELIIYLELVLKMFTETD